MVNEQKTASSASPDVIPTNQLAPVLHRAIEMLSTDVARPVYISNTFDPVSGLAASPQAVLLSIEEYDRLVLVDRQRHEDAAQSELSDRRASGLSLEMPSPVDLFASVGFVFDPAYDPNAADLDAESPAVSSTTVSGTAVAAGADQ